MFSPDRLSKAASTVFRSAGNELLYSDACLAELLNKCGRGKLPIAGTSVNELYRDIVNFGVHSVPILQDDILTAASLPHHHSDPFDRLLIAQSIRLSLPVLTIDGKFRQYGIETIW